MLQDAGWLIVPEWVTPPGREDGHAMLQDAGWPIVPEWVTPPGGE